jgi:phage terminase small subunit
VLAVSRLSRLEDEASALRAEMIESGSTLRRQVQNSRGEVIGCEPYAHPALGQLRRIGIEVAELCTSLGLSPVARHNLGLEVAAREPDFVDELMAKRDRRRRTAAKRAAAQKAAEN